MSGNAVSKLRLALMRHANSASALPGMRDFDRPLDQRGLTEARVVALKAYASGHLTEKIISSPAVRCVETGNVISDVFGLPAAEYEPAFYNGGPDAYTARIRQASGVQSLLLIGHNPFMDSLASLLLAELPSALTFGYPTAAMLIVDLDRPLGNKLLHRAQCVDVITAL